MPTPNDVAKASTAIISRLRMATRKVMAYNQFAEIPLSDGALSIFRSILNHKANLSTRLRKLKFLENGGATQREVDKQRRLVINSLGIIRALSTKLQVKRHFPKETREILEQLRIIASVKEFRKASLLDYEERVEHAEVWEMMERALQKEHKIEPPNWCDDPLRPVPAWAVDPEVRNLYKELEEKRLKDKKGAEHREHLGGGGLRVPPMGVCTGPAVLCAFGGLFSNLVFFTTVPVVAYFRSSCDGKSFAVCDDLPLFILLVFFGSILLLVQWKCVRYVILPQIDITKAFKDYSVLSFSFSKRPFVIWFSVMSVFTFLSQMDTMTNGEFLGKMMATANCIEEYDEHILREAILAAYGSLAGTHGRVLLLVLYLLALLQPLYGIVSCMPLERGVDFVVGMDSKGKKFKTRFKTMADGEQNHGAALMILAEVTRMEAIVFKDLSYAQCKMDLYWGERSQGWEMRYLHLARMEVKRGIARFITVGLLQNAVQTNVQIAWLALSAAVTKELDWQVMFSVVVSLLGMIVNIPDIFEVLQFSWRAHKDLPLEEVRQILDEQQAPTETAAEVPLISLVPVRNQRYCDSVLAMRRGLRGEIYVFAFLFVLYALVVAVAIANLVGVFVCEDRLLHIRGCVHL